MCNWGSSDSRYGFEEFSWSGPVALFSERDLRIFSISIVDTPLNANEFTFGMGVIGLSSFPLVTKVSCTVLPTVDK